MYFTEGRLRQYEHIMQQKPGFYRESVKTMKERGCLHCRYFDRGSQKCTMEKCMLFEE